MQVAFLHAKNRPTQPKSGRKNKGEVKDKKTSKDKEKATTSKEKE